MGEFVAIEWGEWGLVRAGAYGDFERVSEAGGAEADASACELETVEQKGQLGSAAETLVDSRSFLLGNEGRDKCNSVSKTVARGGFIGVVNQARAEIALIGGVEEDEFFGS